MLGGKLRDAVPFASYLFFRFAADATGRSEVRTIDQLVSEARALKARWGFTSHKLKGGVFRRDHELACYRALSEALPGDTFRLRPKRGSSPWKRRSGSARQSLTSPTTITRIRHGD